MDMPRPYRGAEDMQAMLELLQRGWVANNGSYYIHPGDLKWWLYYPPLEGDLWEQIYLWDDLTQPGKILGWALLSLHRVGFDVYVQPELRGTPQAESMYTWAEEQSLKIARSRGKPTIYVEWKWHDDSVLSEHYKQRGYRSGRGYVHLRRTLEGVIPSPELEPGYVVRGCHGTAEVAERALAQYGAFGSLAPFEQYQRRFTSFMHSPVYAPDLDIVAVAADGRVGAFCLVWPDRASKVGLFEPVGTHPIFQRRGLGKAVMLEGLRRMKELGMKLAIVSTFEDNPAAIRLYESVGFRVINRLGTYEKDV
ncbi:MAG: GNAT family N-acetyltransferase [Acidobacteriaceae bacterium]